MSSHRMPLRVMLLITVHVVSTVVMVGFAWAVTPPSTMPDPIGFSWVRAVFSYIMVCQIYLGSRRTIRHASLRLCALASLR